MEDRKRIGRRAILKSSATGLTAAALWPITSVTYADTTNKIGVARQGPSGPDRNENRGDIMRESPWNCALELRSDRSVSSGSSGVLCDAIRRGADLRILTEFIHGEHIDPASPSRELICEVCDFQITYLLDNRWVAGIMQQRQPIALPKGFGAPSMSFFLYNQDGEQGIARPYLDGRRGTGRLGPAPAPDHPDMPKYHQHDNWDADTNAPSHNFVYDFEVFRYFVRDDWRQVLEHDAKGAVVSGSVDDLGDALACGQQVKLAVDGLCSDLAGNADIGLRHEVFIEAGSCYYYTEQKLFIAGADPLVRVRPAIPLRYATRAWDIAWLMARTDGVCVLRRADPYTLKFDDANRHYAMRWFVR
jgi:hypothetical protein